MAGLKTGHYSKAGEPASQKQRFWVADRISAARRKGKDVEGLSETEASGI